jgi:nickel-dependent lactate racemase
MQKRGLAPSLQDAWPPFGTSFAQDISMHVAIGCGLEQIDLEVRPDSLVGIHRAPAAPDLSDPAAAMRQALETPVGFPALRRALTPDDHVAVVVDEHLPHLGVMLTALLEHIAQANVRADAITFVCLPPASGQPWRTELPMAFRQARMEVHDPTDRRRLSYLATTRQGRRIYLNRTVVDADQVVVLTPRGYDAQLGYSGGAGALFPTLSDDETRAAVRKQLSMQPPEEGAWPLRQEVAEVAWLLGAPFLVQIIEGSDSGLAHILGGLVETSDEGQRLLDARWRVEVDRPAELVVAALGGDPGRHDFADLAKALTCAVRVVRPRGRIVLLTGGDPALGEAAAVLRQAEDANGALRALDKQPLATDLEAAFQWASAAEQAHIYILSKMPPESVEHLFAIPLEHAGQVQRLLADAASCVFLPDAHKSLAVLKKEERRKKNEDRKSLRRS